MSRRQKSQWVTAWLAVLGMLVPMTDNRAAPAASKLSSSGRQLGRADQRDRRLSRNANRRCLDVVADGRTVSGVLYGQSGETLANRQLRVIHGGRVVQTIRTDRAGRFKFVAARSGVYLVATANRTVSLRVWSSRTAPPTAVAEVLIQDSLNVVRGQRPLHEVLFADPIMIGLVLAAAVAIPVVISARKKGS